MCSEEVAIKVFGLGKCYQVYSSPRDRLKQFFLSGFQKVLKGDERRCYSEFWALRDVSFEVKRGEVVGIVGRNGSGKSTLLQLICGTLSPTSGIVKTNGRIAALLELGSGFNPEFSGRENVYLNGAIQGLSAEEIDARFDDIVAFAEIGEFIDQPVKNYSSGMLVRLAFSVAISIEPEILIVDEALSVGDELFQRKCFSRIEAIRANGATILFVSHSGAQVIELCDRALLMEAGEKLAQGNPKDVVRSYQRLIYTPAEKYDEVRNSLRSIAEGDSVVTLPESYKPIEVEAQGFGSELLESFDAGLKSSAPVEYECNGAVIQDPAIYTLDGERVNSLVRGNKYRYRYRVVFSRGSESVRFGMSIKTRAGVSLGGALSRSLFDSEKLSVVAGEFQDVEFLFTCILNPDVYFASCGVFGLHLGEEIIMHRITDAFAFRVLPSAIELSTGPVWFDISPVVQ